MEKQKEQNGKIEKNVAEQENLKGKKQKKDALDDAELGGVVGGEGMTDGHIGD